MCNSLPDTLQLGNNFGGQIRLLEVSPKGRMRKGLWAGIVANPRLLDGAHETRIEAILFVEHRRRVAREEQWLWCGINQ